MRSVRTLTKALKSILLVLLFDEPMSLPGLVGDFPANAKTSKALRRAQ